MVVVLGGVRPNGADEVPDDDATAGAYVDDDNDKGRVKPDEGGRQGLPVPWWHYLTDAESMRAGRRRSVRRRNRRRVARGGWHDLDGGGDAAVAGCICLFALKRRREQFWTEHAPLACTALLLLLSSSPSSSSSSCCPVLSRSALGAQSPFGAPSSRHKPQRPRSLAIQSMEGETGACAHLGPTQPCLMWRGERLIMGSVLFTLCGSVGGGCARQRWDTQREGRPCRGGRPSTASKRSCVKSVRVRVCRCVLVQL